MEQIHLQSQLVMIPVYSKDALELKMKRVVELVQEAESLGFALDGFTDENDLLRKMKSTELRLLSEIYEHYLDNASEVELLENQLVMERFHGIACRILDALGMY